MESAFYPSAITEKWECTDLLVSIPGRVSICRQRCPLLFLQKILTKSYRRVDKDPLPHDQLAQLGRDEDHQQDDDRLLDGHEN